MVNIKILFLSLYTYSLTGGIEKVCRIFNEVLIQLKPKISSGINLAMYDESSNQKKNYQAFAGNKINFSYQALKNGLNADIIVLAHINLLIFAKIIRIFKPGKRIILFAHGIEIWNDLPNWKKAFLNEIEIWAVSDFTATQIIKKQQLQKENIKVLNNSLANEFIYPNIKVKPTSTLNKYAIDIDAKIILTVCRLASKEQYKGYDLVLLALKDLVKEYPNLKYFIVGKADDLEKNRVKNLINEFQLQQHVILTGYLSYQELTNLYQLADVFAMPSKGEGFGMVFLEAVANGCKVLAGNADGSVDALLNGKLGLLVDPTSVEAIYLGLIKLLNQPFDQEEFLIKQNLLRENFGFETYLTNVTNLLSIN